MSVVVIATVVPVPEHRAEVIAAFEQIIPAVHAEPGCELYALHENEDRVVMVEKWSDGEALAVHGKGAALQQLGAALRDKLAGPMDVQVVSARPAGDPGKGAL